ncbi:MAG: DUF177 domain-containing protein [Candidatus Promineifilaceae bacterium]|nr:DUF177 domain-containing protein [Candidatus Promineifilaceae bacterium]
MESPIGTFREVELDYPSVQVANDMTLAPLTGKFNATRISEGIFVHGKLYSQLKHSCVRCLEETDVPLTLDIDELFYYPPHAAPENAQVIGENGYIDLSPLVRELAWLDVPIQPICKEDCQGLCIECGQNLNIADCGCEADDIDPRFSILKELLD